MFRRVKRSVDPNSSLIGPNEPLNDILKTPEVLRGGLGDISRMSMRSDEDISKMNEAQQMPPGGRLKVGPPTTQLALHQRRRRRRRRGGGWGHTPAPLWVCQKGARQTVQEIVASIWLIINCFPFSPPKLSEYLGAILIAAPLSPLCDNLICIGCSGPWGEKVLMSRERASSAAHVTFTGLDQFPR